MIDEYFYTDLVIKFLNILMLLLDLTIHMKCIFIIKTNKCCLFLGHT